MILDAERERERFSHQETLKWIMQPIRPTEMLTVYLSDKSAGSDVVVYCALIPNEGVARSLEEPSWDMHLGDGLPGAVKSHENGVAKVRYLRFGYDDGTEPLVYRRIFHGIRKDYFEISEEFRHFHGLYYDKKTESYLKIDDAGNDLVIIQSRPDQIQIRLLEIQQFLAIKEMHLAIQFDCREVSTHPLQKLGLHEGSQTYQEGLLVYCLGYGDIKAVAHARGFSRLLGKRLIQPISKEKSGFWGFAVEEKPEYQSFIVDVDEHGREITDCADPDALGNNFGGNPRARHYLTPVYFKRAVLDKYYQQSGKYSVEDGYLRCAGLWGMRIDNANDKYVTAWLGDLGRELPIEEQRHWRTFNIPPAGGISETAFRRQLLNQFVNSKRPEHVFRARYEALSRACEETMGWQLLLPLDAQDIHHLDGLRVPASEEQREFDDLVLSMTKVLVDSLNDEELKRLIPEEQRKDSNQGIARLEKVLAIRGGTGYESHIKFVRNLQSLRSAGIAHRKGSNFKKISEEFELQEKTLPEVFQGILEKGARFLEYLKDVVDEGILSVTPPS